MENEFNVRPSYVNINSPIPVAKKHFISQVHESNTTNDYYNSSMTFNEEQKSIIEDTNGIVCVSAGPGTGKTALLIARARSIKNKYPDSKIMILSFTKKSAQELKNRLTKNESKNIIISTFHSLSYKLLKANGYNYKVITNGNIENSIIIKIINQYKADTNLEKVKLSLATPSKADKITLDIQYKYIKYLAANKLMSFSMMQVLALNLLKDIKIKKQLQDLADFWQIDEAQDIDEIQYLILKAVLETVNNIILVGDPFQNIYSFRGSIKNMFDTFNKDTKSYYLSTSYRCNPYILGLANKLFTERKPLISAVHESTTDNYPLYLTATDETEEATAIIKKIKEFNSSGIAYKDIAILYRSSFAATKIIEELLNNNVPFKAIGNKLTVQDKPYIEIINLFRAAISVDDIYAIKSILPILNLNSTNIINKLKEIHYIQKTNYLIALQNLNLKFYHQEYINNISDTLLNIKNKTPPQAIKMLLKAGLNKFWGKEKTLICESYFEELSNFNSIESYLYYVDELIEQYNQLQNISTDNAINVSSIHAAKGCEYDVCFIIGLYDGCLPANADNTELEEEKRILYTGITRARHRLCLSYPQKSKMSKDENKPCSFICKAFSM